MLRTLSFLQYLRILFFTDLLVGPLLLKLRLYLFIVFFFFDSLLFGHHTLTSDSGLVYDLFTNHVTTSNDALTSGIDESQQVS